MLPWEPPADELSDLPAAKNTEKKTCGYVKELTVT